MQKSKIKIYFDTSPLEGAHSVRGIGYYTRNLLDHLRRNKNIKLVDSSEDAEVVHFPYFDLFFNTLKPISGKKNVVTVFDVVPLLYPKHYPPGIKGKINLRRQKHALSKVDAVITISETSKKDIVRFLDVPESKIYPIHLAQSREFKELAVSTILGRVVEKYKLPRQFVLYVGDVNYNKNLPALAEACSKIDTPLIIVGKQATDQDVDLHHPENRSFAQFLKKFKDSPNVLRLGYVETEDLVKIYNLATVYCQPSLYEGFGLPILEALSCGTPVAASKIQAHVEMAEGCCVFFDPRRAKDTAQALEKLISDQALRKALATKGSVWVKGYSWDKTATVTEQVYANLLQSK